MARIESFIAWLNQDESLADEKTQSAMLVQLVVIGEAAAHLPGELRQWHPRVDWGRVIGFRNRVVHGYFAVDWWIVLVRGDRQRALAGHGDRRSPRARVSTAEPKGMT